MSLIKKFDLNLLIIFEVLVTESHVSRAAEKVFLSQSAMSHALSRLRDQLGDPILVRTRNGLQPTKRALAMLPEVRRSLKMIEHTISPPEVFDPASSVRQFRIAATDYFETVVFPEWFSDLNSRAPNIRVDIEMITETTEKHVLEEGVVDLIAGLDAEQKVANHLIVTPWLNESLVCLASADNQDIGSSISLNQFLTIDHVIFSDVEGEYYSKVDNWLNQKGLERNCISLTYNHIAAARIVSKTEAIITLPYHMALLFTQILPLKMVTPPKEIPDLKMTLIEHPTYSLDPAIQWLKSEIINYSKRN